MSYCDPEHSNSLYEIYTASWGETFEIWRCYNAGPGGTYDPVYYEKTHSEISYGATVEQVRAWIENNLKPAYSNVTITIAGEGSSDPPAGNYVETLGGSLSITAHPADGWRYELMRRNGVEWTRDNPGEFLNLGATEKIEVVFVEEGAPPTPPSDEKAIQPLFPRIRQTLYSIMPRIFDWIDQFRTR